MLLKRNSVLFEELNFERVLGCEAFLCAYPTSASHTKRSGQNRCRLPGKAASHLIERQTANIRRPFSHRSRTRRRTDALSAQDSTPLGRLQSAT
ncbi:unnamed protein product [Nesidiocoris tenuis]|uniref:Uncharacterized protein n=1 Tax=Nesidiocoris tenuis TaxID=355587 RepID=A0A6H5HJ90_9HEMI|nr:unnamed protein product [Nesidiocoris tenuis]